MRRHAVTLCLVSPARSCLWRDQLRRPYRQRCSSHRSASLLPAKTQKQLPFEHHAPIQPWQASQGRSETQTACHRNETDLLLLRELEDGSKVCLRQVPQEQSAVEHSESCAAIARRSNPSFPVTTSRDEKLCWIEYGNRSSGHVPAAPLRK